MTMDEEFVQRRWLMVRKVLLGTKKISDIILYTAEAILDIV